VADSPTFAAVARREVPIVVPPAHAPRVAAHKATTATALALDPAIVFPAELPISARVRDLAAAIEANPVVIVSGETGSGKTTQLPKICLAMGRGRGARIGVTQPRRIAATSIAARVAGELGVELGREVGYHIRFSDKTGADTRVKFMTDGVLLAEIQSDPLLRAYDTIVLDEAHERSLNVDFLLGHLERILPARPDLRVIISSATLATERFSAFFGGAPVISVSGRTYPVQVVHRPLGDRDDDVAEAIAETVEEISKRDPRGDILVFLPGEREIRQTSAALESHALPHTDVLPLYGRLTQAEQARIFQTSSQRRIVLATNVAETSLTIPGIVYVIDSGLARIHRHDPRTGVTQLLIEPISQASADQRKGRAGRTRSGVCFRLYSKQDHEGRPEHTDPEIFRVGLAGAILQMKSLGLGELATFPFLDPPPKKSVEEGYRLLEELGALDAERVLTELGKKLARLPVDPRIARMILAGEQEGALREVLIIAAGLGVQDPRERPLSAQKRADEAHVRFRDEASDFNALLKVWHFFQEEQAKKNQSQVRKACRDGFLSYARLGEWSDVHHQLSRIARELGFVLNDTPASPEAVLRALLPGLLSRVGMWHPEQRVYIGARQTRFQLHPSSALARAKQPAPFVMTAELVETSQLFGRTAAKIDPAWLEPAGGALCKKSYGEPNWAAKTAQVMNKEQVTLFGIPVVRDRKVHYGPIDPKACRRLFLLHALVRREYVPAKPPPFMEHNRALFEEVRRLRDRARKSDMVADDDAVALFFEKRVPDEVYSGKTFEHWRLAAEAEDPKVLHLSLADVLLDESDEVSLARFPDALSLAGTELPLSYRFDPGEDDDGITVTLPLPLLADVDAGMLEWTIPGWRREKIVQLCHALPRPVREAMGEAMGDANELASTLVERVRPEDGPMLPVLARALKELTGVSVAPEAFDLGELSPHLRFFVRVVDGVRRLGEGRDVAELQERFGARSRAARGALAQG
jgi:ATP-dependent helicase HrpA